MDHGDVHRDAHTEEHHRRIYTPRASKACGRWRICLDCEDVEMPEPLPRVPDFVKELPVDRDAPLTFFVPLAPLQIDGAYGPVWF